ncbi:MAG: AAA family ATPase, partial [Bacilli bacterium]
MLYSLTVKNFAIIDNLEIQFHDGMTVLTGETGAGKSLIIDAIGLLLGKRADTDLIRFGENKAIIEGAFSYEATIGQFLSERGIDHDHESIVIKRELLSSGKSFCRVNGTLVSLGEVVELGELIGDIHSQIDTLGLVHPKNYLRFLENDAIKHDLESYQQALKQYRALKNELESLQKQAADANEKEDFLKFQIKEFELASLSIEEEQQLKQELNQLSSYETLVEQLKEFHDKVYETDAVTNLYLALQTLQKLEHIDLRFQLIRQSFEEKYYDMESILEDPILKIGNMEYDENRIEEINSRLSLYSDMRRKYKKSTAELIAYYEQIAKQIDQIDNIEGYVKALEQKVSA